MPPGGDEPMAPQLYPLRMVGVCVCPMQPFTPRTSDANASSGAYRPSLVWKMSRTTPIGRAASMRPRHMSPVLSTQVA